MPEYTALVIGQAGALRDALGALLTSVPTITAVREASSREAACEILKDGPTALVVVDATSFGPDVTEKLIAMVRAATPNARCAVLTDEAHESIRAAAVDVVLRLGTPAAELRSRIEGLLAEERVLHHND